MKVFKVDCKSTTEKMEKSLVNGDADEPLDLAASSKVDNDVDNSKFDSESGRVNGLSDQDTKCSAKTINVENMEEDVEHKPNVNGETESNANTRTTEAEDNMDLADKLKQIVNGNSVDISNVEDKTSNSDEDSDRNNENPSEVDRKAKGKALDKGESTTKMSSDNCDGNISSEKKDKNKTSVIDDTESSAVKEEIDKSDEKNDSEKENKNSDNTTVSDFAAGSSAATQDKCVDSSNDDIQIIGESKIIQISSPSIPNSSSQNIILLPHMGSNNPPLPSVNHRFLPNTSVFGSNVPGISTSQYSSAFSNMHPGFIMANTASQSSPLSMLPQPVQPPKPKSSLDQIELIRWEIQNRINTRPKYFKPNPTADLGPLAKFLFDIGSDLIKESVYHELVKIQSKKQDDDRLSEKEKEDLEKLKDIERDLNNTVGHLKLRMRKRCRGCHFQTESSNVMYHHKQYPHEDSKNLFCAHCTFVSKQAMSFKFHIESEHNVLPRLHDKKFFYECDLCQYENNQEQKLNIHKARCQKQFRPLFNLHPSCLSGAEINLCLENIFYKPLVPKNLKILQQKHLQQQAALAEARRQQAEVAALAAQKNAQAVIKRPRQPPSIVPTPPTPVRFNQAINRPQIQTRLTSPGMSQVRFNSRSPVSPIRPTVASMLKDKQASKVGSGFPPHHGSAPVGFEVCEICGGYVKDRKALRIHFFYAHRIDLPLNLFDRNQPPLYCATCCVRFWTANGLRKHLDVHAQEKRIPDGFIGEGVSGKCIACGQLVGNIVVHMRVVHNREIHHYTNALMCMFCGASFNSHANVDRHVKDVHGTIDIATGAVKVKGKLKSSPPPLPKIIGPPTKKPALSNNNLVKGSVCVLCNLNFGRNVDLTRHCMRMHHTCMKCGMVVIDKDSLLKHNCLSSPSGTRDCTMCSETGFHPAYYVKHLRDKHLKKFYIDVARLSVPVIERWTKRPYPFKKVPEEFVEISDSDEDAPVARFKVDTPVKSPRKKVRIGPASKINRASLSNGIVNSSGICDKPDKEIMTVAQDKADPKRVSPSQGSNSNKRKQSFDSSSTPERSSKRKK